MKIMAISSSFVPAAFDGTNLKQNKKAQALEQMKTFSQPEQLAGFDVSRTLLVRPNAISFTSDNSVLLSEKSKKLMEEIEAHKKALDVLKKAGDSEAVIKAKNENSFCDYFSIVRSDLYGKAVKAAENAKEIEKGKHNSLANWFCGYPSAAYYNSFDNSEYSVDKRKYDNLIGRYDSNKKIIEGGEQTKLQRDERIKELELLIEAKSKMLDYTEIPSMLDEYMNGEFGLNSKLAGYEDLKADIKEFIGQLNNNTGKVPSCVMLYGAIGTGKTTALNCVRDSAKGKVDVVRFSLPSNIDFKRRFEMYQEQAKRKYQEEGKRTILLMDDAEEYFAKSYETALEHPEDYSSSDMARLKEINTLGTNKYASAFKHILDVLSSVPDENDSDKAAMTIFITTNYPHIMHDDLISREGKVHSFHVGPADTHNLAEVTKFYFKENNAKLDIIKTLKYKSPNIQDDSMKRISFITDKARGELKKLFAEGAIDNLSIDIENTDFESMMKPFRPSVKQGAFTNDQIAHISKDAFEKYLENPMVNYKKHFIKEMVHSKRAIDQNAYAHFLQIEKKVNLKSGRLSNEGNELYNNVRELLIQKLSGEVLSEDENKNLDEFLKVKRPRYEALKDKQKEGFLENESEAKELEQLCDIFDLIESD